VSLKHCKTINLFTENPDAGASLIFYFWLLFSLDIIPPNAPNDHKIIPNSCWQNKDALFVA